MTDIFINIIAAYILLFYQDYTFKKSIFASVINYLEIKLIKQKAINTCAQTILKAKIIFQEWN